MTSRVLPVRPSLPKLYAQSIFSGRRHGKDLPDVQYSLLDQTIDLDHLAGYQRICGFRVSDVLPVTYLHILAFPLAVSVMSEQEFPFALPGLVHVQNTIHQQRALTARDRFDLRVHAENLREHRVGRQVDLVAEGRVDDGLVWTGRSTYLHREMASSGSRRSDAQEAKPARTVWRLPADAGRKYAAVSGDFNPIHLNPLAAKAFGFPRTIAHGMWVAARCLATLESRLPAALEFDVEFKAPVLLPSTVAFSADRVGDRWQLAVQSPKSGKPHLAATIQ